MGAIPLGFFGIALLFRRREFVIDRERGTLEVVDQGFFQSKATATFRIDGLEVRILTLPMQPPGPAVIPRNVYHGMLFENGEPLLQLRRGQDLGLVQELAEGFAKDLGRPFSIMPPPAA